MAKKKAKKKSGLTGRKKGRVPAGLASYQAAQRAKKLAAESPEPKRKKASKKTAKKTAKKTRKAATRAEGSPIGRVMALSPEIAKAIHAFEAKYTLPRKKTGKKAVKKTASKKLNKAGNVNATAAQVLGGGAGLGWMRVGKGHMHNNHPLHSQAMKVWVCSAAKPRGCGGGGKVILRSNY